MDLLELLRRVNVEPHERAEYERLLGELSHLQERSTMLKSILDSMSDGVAVVDARGNYVLFNRAAEKFLGKDAPEEPAETWAARYGAYMPDMCTPYPPQDQPIVRALRGEPTNGVRMFLRNSSLPDGVHISVSGRPWLDQQGNIVGGVVVFGDVSALKKAEDELRQLNESLEAEVRERTAALMKTREQLLHSQKLDALGRLVGGVAHDLNNQFMVVLGYCSLIMGKLDPNDSIRKQVECIKEAGDKSTAMTRQLLAFGRKQSLEPKIFNLSDLIRAMEKVLARVLTEKIELRTKLDPALGNVNADAAQIDQVILNLVNNARDAMPGGGVLSIETSNITLDESYTRYRSTVKPGEYILLVVSDTGIGMPSEVVERIFEPFYTTKEPGKGTGLGLSMVHGVVNQSGGHIWVYSEPGRGTTFKIYLPRVDAPQSNASRAHADEYPRGKGEAILVVEDNQLLRTLLAEALSDAGYRVVEASSGPEAMKVFRDAHGKFDLVVSDVVMPKMDGPALIAEFHKLRPALPVIFMSGYTEAAFGGHESAPPLYAKLLQKPVSISVLLSEVHETLSKT